MRVRRCRCSRSLQEEMFDAVVSGLEAIVADDAFEDAQDAFFSTHCRTRRMRGMPWVLCGCACICLCVCVCVEGPWACFEGAPLCVFLPSRILFPCLGGVFIRCSWLGYLSSRPLR